MLNNNSARCSIQSGSLSGSTPWRAVPRFDFLGGGEGGKAELSGLRTEGRVSLAGSLRERIHGTQGDRSWDAEKSLVQIRAMESLDHWPHTAQDGLAGPRWLIICTASPFDGATVPRSLSQLYSVIRKIKRGGG